MPNLRGFFINLDRNQARSAAMSRHLADVGMASHYQRFCAVDGKSVSTAYTTKLDPGNLGLWLTHERLLAANQASDAHLHILEDDAILPKDAETCFTDVLSNAEENCPGWDLIYTELCIDLGLVMFQLIARCKEDYLKDGKIRLYPLTGFPMAGTSSLIINRNSLQKYLTLIEGNWTLGMPLDIFLRTQINKGSFNAYATLPFATTLSHRAVESDIRGTLDDSRRLMAVYRGALFKDADVNTSLISLRQLTATVAVSDLANCYLEAVKFALSNKWVGF